MKQFYSLFFSLVLMLGAYACKHADAKPTITPILSSFEGISWYKIEDIDKMDLGNKKVLIDMYTDWCGWCKVMDQKTFSDPEVIKYLNEHFVMVKFNAEQKEPLVYRGTTYEYVKQGRSGVNMLAAELMNGQLSYPTIVYMNSKLERINISIGYKTPQQLLSELKVL